MEAGAGPFDFYAGEAIRISGEVLQANHTDRMVLVLKEAVGVRVVPCHSRRGRHNISGLPRCRREGNGPKLLKTAYLDLVEKNWGRYLCVH
ncbi:MAG: hypothetical protein ACUVXI_01715 [bacterium]